MIQPLATLFDPTRGLLLMYCVDGERQFMPISIKQNVQWKRWLRKLFEH